MSSFLGEFDHERAELPERRPRDPDRSRCEPGEEHAQGAA